MYIFSVRAPPGKLGGGFYRGLGKAVVLMASRNGSTGVYKLFEAMISSIFGPRGGLRFFPKAFITCVRPIPTASWWFNVCCLSPSPIPRDLLHVCLFMCERQKFPKGVPGRWFAPVMA